MRSRYVLITPVRDEEAYIRGYLASIAAQTAAPALWIVVDDGSTDDTARIVQEYSVTHSFLRLLRLPPRADRRPGGEAAIEAALRTFDPRQYDFIARFDADLVFPMNYMAEILRRFRDDPTLGIAGGVLYVPIGERWIEERTPVTHVRGALKTYRSACYLEIGGLTPRIGWDTLDEAAAGARGWKTRSFGELPALHRRPTGAGLERRRIYRERGLAEYLTWSLPLWVCGKVLMFAIRERSITAAGAYLWGFVSSYLRREPRRLDDSLIRFRRREQAVRMLAMLLDLGTWRGTYIRAELPNVFTFHNTRLH